MLPEGNLLGYVTLFECNTINSFNKSQTFLVPGQQKGAAQKMCSALDTPHLLLRGGFYSALGSEGKKRNAESS